MRELLFLEALLTDFYLGFTAQIGVTWPLYAAGKARKYLAF